METLQYNLFNITKSLSIQQCKACVSFMGVRYTPNPDSFSHSLHCTAQLETFTACTLNQCIMNISLFIITSYENIIVSAYRYIAITTSAITAVFVEYLRQFLIDLHQIYRHSSVP